MLIVVTEKMVLYKGKVCESVYKTRELSVIGCPRAKPFWKFPNSFVVVAFQSKKCLRKQFIFHDFASSKSKNHHRRYK